MLFNAGAHNEESLGEIVWSWVGDDLVSSECDFIAAVRADVLSIGSTSLLLERSVGAIRFRLRGTSTEGAFGFVYQPGFSVSRLKAVCESRRYTMRRASPWRRNRVIELADGGVIAYLRPRLNGTVDVYAGEVFETVPRLDIAFLTWACVLVDAPRRVTEI